MKTFMLFFFKTPVKQFFDGSCVIVDVDLNIKELKTYIKTCSLSVIFSVLVANARYAQLEYIMNCHDSYTGVAYYRG